jgi:hypothetical protein
MIRTAMPSVPIPARLGCSGGAIGRQKVRLVFRKKWIVLFFYSRHLLFHDLNAFFKAVRIIA